jgi:hypothetical protein
VAKQWPGSDRRAKTERRAAPDYEHVPNSWIVTDDWEGEDRRKAPDRREKPAGRGKTTGQHFAEFVLDVIHHPNAVEYGLGTLVVVATLSAVIYDSTGVYERLSEFLYH